MILHSMKQILDLGCGKRKREGAIGIDIHPNTDADIIHDLNIFPYPFETSCFDEVYADNVIEHLDNVVNVVDELHRIIKPGGLLVVKVPYFRSRYAYMAPDHKHFFTVESFTYFDPGHIHHTLYNYSRCRFKTMSVAFDEDLHGQRFWNLILIPLKKFCNRYPVFYEIHLSHLFPLSELTFNFTVIKDSTVV